MKNTILLLGLFSLLMSGCTSSAPAQPVLEQATAIPIISPTIETISETIAPATVPPTQTALPSPTPSPSPSPTATPPGISAG